jgi:hypothetical protein
MLNLSIFVRALAAMTSPRRFGTLGRFRLASQILLGVAARARLAASTSRHRVRTGHVSHSDTVKRLRWRSF